jgi:Flp pilus assembly protein TadG
VIGRLRRYRDQDEGGQAIVEFALMLPLFLLLVTGIIDLSRAVWEENTLAYAAREGTRYAIVHGSGSTTPSGPCTNCNDANITAVVQAAAVGVGNVTATTNYPDGINQKNGRVSVDATALFVPLPSQYLIGGVFRITLRGGSELVIQR